MLIDLLNTYGGEWIFTAPPGVETAGPVTLDGGIVLHPVQLDEELRHRHYDTISINLLLGLLHYLHDTSVEPLFDNSLWEGWAGYEAVNRLYAKQLAERSANTADELVLLNDPHLMLVPEFFASQQLTRRSRLTYFLGTPWCEPDYFTVLPERIRTRLLESLLNCDVVGFHARRWSDAFLACCERFLPHARVDADTVTYREHVTHVVSAPFPLDVGVLDTMADESATRRWTERLEGMAAGRRTMVRADRIDLWKNIPRGFAAYAAALERNPRMAEECWFAAVATPPSRAAERHLAYQQASEAAVRRINERFGRPEKEAVTLIHPGKGRDSRNCVVAALRMSSAAVVNSTYDGLNLFAKEAAYLLDDSAELLLSANAGVHEQLGPLARTIDPFDLDQTSRAMEESLSVGGGPGAGTAHARRMLLRSESPEDWLRAVFLL